MKAPDRRTGDSGTGALPRVVAVVALLVLATLGAAAREGAYFSPAGLLNFGATPVAVAFGIGVLAAAGLALAALAMLLTRTGGPVTAPGRRTMILWAALAAAVVGVILGVATLRSPHLQKPPRVPLRIARAAPSPAATLLVALAALAALAAVIWWRRRPAPADVVTGGPDSPLTAAVTAGSAAFGAAADTRQAIIACYAAMEDALAAAGSPRQAADTPEEVLGRAQRDGTLRTPAAARLTELFREARFSQHPLGDADRGAAELALGDEPRQARPGGPGRDQAPGDGEDLDSALGRFTRHRVRGGAR